jgi:hypothetical protein
LNCRRKLTPQRREVPPRRRGSNHGGRATLGLNTADFEETGIELINPWKLG